MRKILCIVLCGLLLGGCAAGPVATPETAAPATAQTETQATPESATPEQAVSEALGAVKTRRLTVALNGCIAFEADSAGGSLKTAVAASGLVVFLAETPPADLPGYAEFGLTAYRQWRIWQGTLETRADIKNLFDKQYEIVARYPMPGRSWQFSINYKF